MQASGTRKSLNLSDPYMSRPNAFSGQLENLVGVVANARVDRSSEGSFRPLYLPPRAPAKSVVPCSGVDKDVVRLDLANIGVKMYSERRNLVSSRPDRDAR